MLTAGGATNLPDDTSSYLEALPGLRRIVVLGGATAIPEGILAQLRTLLD